MSRAQLTDRLAERQLARIRRYLDTHYGSTAVLQRRYEKATGQPIPRSNFTRWLHRSPKQRMQPALGTYLLLERLVATMKREDERRAK